MHKLIRAYNAKEKVYDDPSKLFTSAYILSAFATDSAATDEAIEDELDKLNIYATYSGDDYALGKTRDALNEALSLDRARGRILSRPVGPFEAGRRVDDEVLHYIHLHCINEIYVKAIPDVVGYRQLSQKGNGAERIPWFQDKVYVHPPRHRGKRGRCGG